MAGGSGGRSLEETPTWAVAVVCFVLVAISIIIEYIIHLVGKWLKRKQKRALFESLEKIKSELMLLGFISLLLTVVQEPISEICISKKLGDTWHPCGKKEDEKSSNYDEQAEEEHRRKLLSMSDTGAAFRRILAGDETDKCASQGKVSFVSSDGLNQLHIFIFVLALFHVLYSILTIAFGRFKMKKWKAWERETRTAEYQFSHDPERFRFTRETSFGRRHVNFWSHSTILLWIVCFFRQFVRSVTKVDYFTLRHGFIMTHLAPHTHTGFNFQKYINRSLQEDFKVVVGISPLIWLLAVLFLLFNTDGWYSYLWLPFIPLVIILLVGTKLQVIITKMGLKIGERSNVVQGVPLVELGDDLFWFNRPRFLLFLINFVLFQNAFQLAFFFWSWYEFGLKSCFHEETEEIIIRISMGVLIHILCSYVTLPLYALVTQMGSTLKPTIFNERVAMALRNWHRTARKNIKLRKQSSGLVTPMSSRPETPSHSMSPVHLLRHYKSDLESYRTSPRRSNYDNSETEDSPSTSYHQHQIELGHTEHHLEVVQEPKPSQVAPLPQLDINIKDFSFDRRISM